MASKSILLAVTEPQMLVDITDALGADWDVASVASEADALEKFEGRSFDALLVDFNLESPDASELLNQVLAKHPDTVRFLLAYEADLALVAAKVEGSPHILPKPVEVASVKSRIENAVKDSNPDQSASEPANGATDAPTIPTIYSHVLRALDASGATNEQVGEIIARDASLTSEVLRLTNSSYLGLPRNITDPVEAVESLGLETIKAVVMARQFLAEHSRLKPGYLSLGQIWQHSINVGQIARDLVLFETKDRTLASQALTAGLLHDLGKIVLATNFDDLYGRVYSLARKQPVAIWDVEKEMFGANHGEIGACLVGMWNMSSAVVEAAALHHEPPLGEHDQFNALAAVHVANVLEHELFPHDNGMAVAPIINTPFLNQLGLLHRLPMWRAAFANHLSGNFQPQIDSDETEQFRSPLPSVASRSRTANYLPGPATPTLTSTTSGQPGSQEGTSLLPSYRRSWIYAGAAAVLVLFVLWFRPPSQPNHTDLAYARTPARTDEPSRRDELPRVPEQAASRKDDVPRTSQPAASRKDEFPRVPEKVSISDESAAPPASPVPSPISKPAPSATPEPAAATTPKAPVTAVPAPTVAPEKKAPDFQLKGIIFNNSRPSAIINGQIVNVGDDVDGATVVAIKSTSVTLQINGQRKTYILR